MKAVPLPSARFKLNRQRLAARLPPRSLAVSKTDDIMPTNADRFYLAGVHQQEPAMTGSRGIAGKPSPLRRYHRLAPLLHELPW